MIPREAKIIEDPQNLTLMVECYEDGELRGIIDVSNHSYFYAEDVVENWEIGVLNMEVISAST